jgi:hypothetical protein
MSRYAGFLIVFIGYFMPPQSSALMAQDVFPATDCIAEHLKIDLRYGKASQHDPDLQARGLTDPGISMLCGPVCLANAMMKVRTLRGIKSPFLTPVDEIDFISKSLAPSAGLSPQSLKTEGMLLTTLKSVIESALSLEGLNGRVEVHTVTGYPDFVRGIKLPDLIKATTNSKFVIVLMGRYKTSRLKEISNRTRTSGHYMIFSGFDPNDPKRVFFSDPESYPPKIRSAHLKKVKPSTFEDSAYIVDFDSKNDLEKARTILITDAIFVNF